MIPRAFRSFGAWTGRLGNSIRSAYPVLSLSKGQSERSSVRVSVQTEAKAPQRATGTKLISMPREVTVTDPSL